MLSIIYIYIRVLMCKYGHRNSFQLNLLYVMFLSVKNYQTIIDIDNDIHRYQVTARWKHANRVNTHYPLESSMESWHVFDDTVDSFMNRTKTDVPSCGPLVFIDDFLVFICKWWMPHDGVVVVHHQKSLPVRHRYEHLVPLAGFYQLWTSVVWSDF